MFICLDIETTGLNPNEAEVIEVAIVRFDHEKIIEEWSTLVKPPVPIPEFTTRLTGIDDEMVKNAPKLDEVKDIIMEKLGNEPIMGHFIFFDINFLNTKGCDIKNTPLDSCQLARVILHKEPSYSLEVLVQKLALNQPDAHRALDDVKANIELFWKMTGHLQGLSKKSKKALKPLMEKSTWPWATIVLDRIKQEKGDLIENTASERLIHNEEHCDLSKHTIGLSKPFLVEEGSHTYQDLINYAIAQNESSLLSINDLSMLPKHKDLAIINHPNEYVNEKRLEIYLSKDKLDTVATMLGAKICLWLEYTQTGTRGEIKLHREEKTAWLDICCQEGDTPTSFYKKAIDQSQKKQLIAISHQYFLKDRSRKDPLLKLPKNIIIGECEELVKEIEWAWQIRLDEGRFIQDLDRLKDENTKATEVLEHISSRISILFGLIGMVIQSNREGKDHRHTLLVEAFHRNTIEWNKITKTAESIESAVATLANDLKASPLLDEFLRYLGYLTLILNNNGPVLWMTLNHEDQAILHSFPSDTSQLFSERVWKNIEKLHMFCHRGNLKDDFQFLKNELGIGSNVEHKVIDSIYPLPIIDPETKISKPNDPRNPKEVSHEIGLQMEKIEGDIFILVNSMKSAEQLYYGLGKKVKEHGKKLFVQNMGGGMGKISKMSQKTKATNIFVGKKELMDFIIKEGGELKLLAVQRFPFAPPSDPIQKSRASHYENAYEDFSLPQANLKLQSIFHAFLGNNWEGKQILMLDPRRNFLL